MPLARIKGQETRSIKEGISVDEMQSTEIRDVKNLGGGGSYETRGPPNTPRLVRNLTLPLIRFVLNVCATSSYSFVQVEYHPVFTFGTFLSIGPKTFLNYSTPLHLQPYTSLDNCLFDRTVLFPRFHW